MAGFADDLQSQYFKNLSLPFLEIDSGLDFINQYSEMNSIVLDNSSMNLQSILGCCSDNFLSQAPLQPDFPTSSSENLSGFFARNCTECPDSLPVSKFPATEGDGNQGHSLDNKKRKMVTVLESNSGNSSTPISEIGFGEEDKITTKNNSGRGKRIKSGNNKVSNGKSIEKPKEIIHVRARRGQATDSHSLAERVRREKINERMRCLQDLVPGCYKTMGLAVMLDEIINYVQSLQHQVEFLSMKLSAASSFYDFSLDMEPAETQQVLFQQLYRV